MKVFISWSGERSKAYAETLQYWISIILPQVDPWVSSKNITSGQDWHRRITTELGHSRFGITCITPDNQQKPWVNFEAGAISKHVDAKDGVLVPLLFGFEKASDFTGPLSHFQARLATPAEIRALMHDINNASDAPRPPDVLDDAMTDSWTRLNRRLQVVEDEHGQEKAAPRPDSEVLEEALDLLRGLAMPARLTTSPNPAQPRNAKTPQEGLFSLVKRELGDVTTGSWMVESRSAERAARVITEEMPSQEASNNIRAIAELVLGWTVEFSVDPEELRWNEELAEHERRLREGPNTSHVASP